MSSIKETVDNQILPLWNLTDLYSSFSDPAIDQDINSLTESVDKFCSEYNGIISDIHQDSLAKCIHDYENIQKLIARLYSFAHLCYSTDLSNAESKIFLQKIHDIYAGIASKLSFLQVEINNISQEKLDSFDSGKILHYMPFVRNVRNFKEHILSQEIESILIQKDASGILPIVRLFDEYSANLRFNIDNTQKTLAESISLLDTQDKSRRDSIGAEIGKVFRENAWFFSLIFNTIPQNKAFTDKLRKYQNPISSRNLDNFIEDDVVEILISTVKNRYSDISHKYYALKAQLLGLEKLDYCDRNAPLSFHENKQFSFQEAKEIVIEAYASFSSKLSAIVEQFFDNNWIDAKPAEYKNSGAFCSSTTSDLHPYVLMNFMGKSRDVATLAHELGHGMHMYLSRKQGQLMQDTPLTLAETASIFGEKITFEKMLTTCSSNEERLAMLCRKIEDSINTVIRQIAFCEFEKKLHERRKISELSIEQINQIWLEVQSESLGNSVKIEGDYQYFWCYISHFIHSPFYVYAYAFGELLVNALYEKYKECKTQDALKEFENKYIAMLEAGGTLHHSELLKPFNLSIYDASFWHSGLDTIAKMIDVAVDTYKKINND